MLARVTSIQAEATEEVLAFRDAVLRQAQALPGFRGAVDLVDPASGRAIAVTLWADEESLRASERAARPRGEGGPRVEVYEARWYPPPA
jgi:hypothetical protein